MMKSRIVDAAHAEAKAKTAVPAFATEWARLGKSGVPQAEPGGMVSVAPDGEGVRLYYEPVMGAQILRALPVPSDEERSRPGCPVLRALNPDRDLERAVFLLRFPTHCWRCGGRLEAFSGGTTAELVGPDPTRVAQYERDRRFVREHEVAPELPERLRCPACGQGFYRAGGDWIELPTTERQQTIEWLAKSFESLFCQAVEEPVEVARDVLGLDDDPPRVVASFQSLRGANGIAHISRSRGGVRPPGPMARAPVALRRQRGRTLIFDPITRSAT